MSRDKISKKSRDAAGKAALRVRAENSSQEKNEKTRKRKAGVERKQANFKEAARYPSAVAQGAARRKNGLWEWSARGNWDPREGQQPFRPNPNGVGDCITTLRRLLIGTV